MTKPQKPTDDKSRDKTTSVMGYRLPPARLTLWAYFYFLIYCGLPFLGVMALLDLILYQFAKEAGVCYAVLCLFD